MGRSVLLADRGAAQVARRLAVRGARDEPERPCSFCNRCAVLTAVQPVGCYDPARFDSQDAMEEAILRWSVDPELDPREAVAADDAPPRG